MSDSNKLDAIFQRDKGVCHICLHGVDRIEASLDHLQAQSQQGGNERSNLALAHKICNEARGPTSLKTVAALRNAFSSRVELILALRRHRIPAHCQSRLASGLLFARVKQT